MELLSCCGTNFSNFQSRVRNVMAAAGMPMPALSNAKRAKIDGDCAQILKLLVTSIGVRKANALWKKAYPRKVAGKDIEVTALDEIKELDRIRHVLQLLILFMLFSF